MNQEQILERYNRILSKDAELLSRIEMWVADLAPTELDIYDIFDLEVLYAPLINSHIDVISKTRQWHEMFKNNHVVDPEIAKQYPFYQEADVIYVFHGEMSALMTIANKELFNEAIKGIKALIKNPTYTIEYIDRDLFILHRKEADKLDIFEHIPNLSIEESEYPKVVNHHRNNTIIQGHIDSLPTSFVAIDFETFYPQHVSACSVGMVKYIDGKQCEKYYTKIRPPFDLDIYTGEPLTRIHGLKKEDLINERTMKNILPEIEQFVGDFPLVAHNHGTEKYCFIRTCEYYDLHTSLLNRDFLDTIPIAERIEAEEGFHGKGTYGLDAVCRRFGVPCLEHHHAGDDAEMCGNLFVKLGRIINLGEPADIFDLTTLKLDPIKIRGTLFEGKTVVLSGMSAPDKTAYKEILQKLGARTPGSVSNKTQILIYGSNSGEKKQHAIAVGAQLITEDEFLTIIKSLS